MSDLSLILSKIEKLQKQMDEMSSAVLNADAAARFLGMSKSTFDKITRPGNMLIPTATINGKSKAFLKKDLIEFVESRKQSSI